MGLSRRHLLLALGLALPAAALLPEDAEAASTKHHKPRRRIAHAKLTPKKKPQAHASHRRRRPPAA